MKAKTTLVTILMSLYYELVAVQGMYELAKMFGERARVLPFIVRRVRGNT